MQTLGISESTPAGEGRVKSLLWPSVRCGEDVDYLGTQGYWICSLVAVVSLFFTFTSGQPIIGVLLFCFYFIGGVGVRERSLYAAIMVLGMYALDLLVGGLGVVRIIFAALLLSNVRGTWVAAHWNRDAEEASLPPRLDETLTDKFTDKFPAWLWPKIRYVYYVFAFLLLALVVVGLLIRLFIKPHP
jgi:hypothetical protein